MTEKAADTIKVTQVPKSDKALSENKSSNHRGSDNENTHKQQKSPSQDNEVREINGFENKQEPTKHGDWSIDGRCYDF